MDAVDLLGITSRALTDGPEHCLWSEPIRSVAQHNAILAELTRQFIEGTFPSLSKAAQRRLHRQWLCALPLIDNNDVDSSNSRHNEVDHSNRSGSSCSSSSSSSSGASLDSESSAILMGCGASPAGPSHPRQADGEPQFAVALTCVHVSHYQQRNQQQREEEGEEVGRRRGAWNWLRFMLGATTMTDTATTSSSSSSSSSIESGSLFHPFCCSGTCCGSAAAVAPDDDAQDDGDTTVPVDTETNTTRCSVDVPLHCHCVGCLVESYPQGLSSSAMSSAPLYLPSASFERGHCLHHAQQHAALYQQRRAQCFAKLEEHDGDNNVREMGDEVDGEDEEEEEEEFVRNALMEKWEDDAQHATDHCGLVLITAADVMPRASVGGVGGEEDEEVLPIAVSYCFLCGQFSPFTVFERNEKGDSEVRGVDGDTEQEQEVQTQDAMGEPGSGRSAVVSKSALAERRQAAIDDTQPSRSTAAKNETTTCMVSRHALGWVVSRTLIALRCLQSWASPHHHDVGANGPQHHCSKSNRTAAKSNHFLTSNNNQHRDDVTLTSDAATTSSASLFVVQAELFADVRDNEWLEEGCEDTTVHCCLPWACVIPNNNNKNNNCRDDDDDNGSAIEENDTTQDVDGGLRDRHEEGPRLSFVVQQSSASCSSSDSCSPVCSVVLGYRMGFESAEMVQKKLHALRLVVSDRARLVVKEVDVWVPDVADSSTDVLDAAVLRQGFVSRAVSSDSTQEEEGDTSTSTNTVASPPAVVVVDLSQASGRWERTTLLYWESTVRDGKAMMMMKFRSQVDASGAKSSGGDGGVCTCKLEAKLDEVEILTLPAVRLPPPVPTSCPTPTVGGSAVLMHSCVRDEQEGAQLPAAVDGTQPDKEEDEEVAIDEEQGETAMMTNLWNGMVRATTTTTTSTSTEGAEQQGREQPLFVGCPYAALDKTVATWKTLTALALIFGKLATLQKES